VENGFNGGMDTTKLLDESEAGDFLSLTPRQVLKLARRGELPSVILPGDEIRFDPSDIRRWVDSRKRPAAEGGAT
jgi:predicted DNA-binding transcriptional regulator AlpA